ncbi:MAG: MCE family protein [Nocardioides sp.]|nr:MCE family protein [Nocardioides sp.]
MSDLLYPHAQGSPRAVRLRQFGIGALAVAVFVTVAAYLGGSYIGLLTRDLSVDARLTTTGDSLGVGSDVKFRGLRVGRVLEVVSGKEPSARVVLMSEHADEIPGDVVARVLPGTLFGNEYVELLTPEDGPPAGSTGPIADGAVIPADRSARTLRLMDTFSATQRLLVAVDPARLDAAISQLSSALDGRGDDLARFVRDADRLLAAWTPHEETFYEDLELIARNVDTLADIEPQLVSALQDSLPVARTIAEKERATRRLLTGGTTLLTSVNGFLTRNTDAFVTVLHSTAATIEAFSERHAPFEELLRKLPPVLVNGANAIKGTAIRMNAAIGGQFLDPYDADDCPRYGRLEGKSCRGAR